MTRGAPQHARAAGLARMLELAPHPEGGWYRELFRSPLAVQPGDARPPRSALTTIDFVLADGAFSAWHRVRSDEVWHLLEGGLTLWLAPPALDTLHVVELGAAMASRTPRHVVPADWWQAATHVDGGHAYVGATVGPGFDFADFAFGRDDAALVAALAARWPHASRWL